MGSIFQRYRQAILLAVLLIYAIVQIMSARLQSRYQLTWTERVIVAVTSPPQKLFTFFLDKANSIRLGYLYLVDTRKNYLELIKSHRNLVLKVAELEEERQENLRMRTLLGFKERIPLKMVAARVVSLGTSTFTHSVRIDKGFNDGLRETMPVVTSDGIVGHVVNATDNYANVLLLTDPNGSIDVVDQTSRSRGILQGQGTDALHLEFVPRGEPIEKGDLLVSSGLDNIYPKGLPVGMLTDKRQDPSSIFLEADVKPTVNFSRLEEVLVITNLEHPVEKEKSDKSEKRP